MACVLTLLLLTTPLFAIPGSLYQALKKEHLAPTEVILVIDTSHQTLSLYKMGKIVQSYSISSAKNGNGQEEGSEKTPLGLHAICSKYGEGARPYTIFRARKNTGEIWSSKKKYRQDDLVLTRILCLQGLEEGVNLGKDSKGTTVDSELRLIYIHATNHEEDLGSPASKGCIRMSSEDIIDLFDQVPIGSLVWITTHLTHTAP